MPDQAFPALRQSLLSQFDTCALSAKLSINHEHGWSTHPQARGTMFHRVAAKCMAEMARHQEPSIDATTAQDILTECLRQDDIDRTCPICNADAERITSVDSGLPVVRCINGHEASSAFVNLPASEIKDLRWTVAKWATDNTWDIDCLVDIEQRLQTTVTYPAADGTPIERVLTGQLDVLFSDPEDGSHVTIVDYKDTWALPAPSSLSFGGYFQQRMYALLVMDTYPGVARVTTSELYVRLSESRTATVWRQDLPEIRDELAALAARFDRSVAEDVWAPTPSSACGWCVNPAGCPIITTARGEGRIETDEDSASVAALLTVASALVKQYRAALKNWTDIHGPQEIQSAKGRRVWGHRKKQRTTRPTQAELNEALASGGRVDVEALYRTTVGTAFEQYTPDE